MLDFEHHNNDPLLGPRNAMCFLVGDGVNGESFTVNRESVPISQLSNNRGIQWKGTGMRNGPRGEIN